MQSYVCSIEQFSFEKETIMTDWMPLGIMYLFDAVFV